jgi:hypothetical protein
MKTLATLCALLFVHSAFANCPDLRGDYPYCRAEIGNGPMVAFSDIRLTQQATNQGTLYSMDYTYSFDSGLSIDGTKRINADGKKVTLPLPWDESLTYDVTTSCNRNRVLETIVLPERYYTVVYEKQGSALVVTHYGPEAIDSVTICE